MSHKRAWEADDGGPMTWWAFKNAMKVGAAHGYASEADAIAASFGLRPHSERLSSGGTLHVDGGDRIVVGAYDVTVLGALHTALVGASFWQVRFERSRTYEGAPLESNERVAQRVVCGGVGVDDRGIYMDSVGGARMHLFLAPPLSGVRLNVDHTEALTARVEYGTTTLEQAICPQAQEKRARDAPWKMFLVIPQSSFMRRDELSQALRATPAPSSTSSSSSRPAKKAKGQSPELTVLRPEGMADRVRKHRDDKKPAPPEAWDALSGDDQLETARSFFRDLAAACDVPPQVSSVAEKVHIISILAPFVEHMTKAGGGGLEAVKMHAKVQKCLRGNGLYPHALQAMFSDTPTQQQIERFRENYKTHWTPPTADDMAFLIRRRKLCMTDISAGRDVEIAAQFRFNAGKRYSGASDDKKDHISMLGMRDSGEAKRYAGLLKHMYREQWKKIMAKLKADEAKGRATAQQQKRAAAAKGKGVRPTDPDELCTWMRWVLKAAHKRYGRHKYALDKWDFVFEHVYRKWNKDYGTAHSSATDTLFLTLLGQDQSWILNEGIRRLDRPSPAHDDAGVLQAAEILQRYNDVLSDELRAQLRASSGMVVEVPASVALPPVQGRVVVDTQVKNKRLVQRCAWDAYLHFARSVDAACPQEFCSIGMFARVLERGWYRRNRRQLAALPEAISAALLDDALRHSVDNYVEHATIGAEAMAGLRAALAVCRSMVSQAAADEDSGAYSVERAKRQSAIIAAIHAALSDVSKAESFHSKPFVLGELRWPDYLPVLHMIQTAQTDPGVMANVVKLLTAVTAKTLSGAEPSSEARPEDEEDDDTAPPPWREDVEEKSTRSVKVGKETEAWLAAWKSMFRANKNTP